MTQSQRAGIDKMIDEGREVRQGVIPYLDPIAGFHADLWNYLRASTPIESPIAIDDLAYAVGEDRVHRYLPMMQLMDGVLFRSQRERLEAQRKKAEAEAKARRGGRG